LHAMSELRQRHGGEQTSTLQEESTLKRDMLAMKSDNVRPKPALYLGGTARWEDDEVGDIFRATVIPRTKYVMKSNSNKAQAAKEALEEDPYSLEKIIDLGFIYASEVQYEKAGNVLMRGWKRVGELTDPAERFYFLMELAEVSFRNRLYKQAHAVLMDIDEPQDYYEKKAYQLLSCHAHAEIGDGSKALSVFIKAIDGETFGSAIKIWAACALRLRKVGAHEPGKEAIIKKARTGQDFLMDQSRIQTVESWAMLNDTPTDLKGLLNFEDGMPKWIIVAGVMFIMMCWIAVLYWFEVKNLRNMKMLF